eukprot:6203058-Pleurochrysis_carterae.AAC.3
MGANDVVCARSCVVSGSAVFDRLPASALCARLRCMCLFVEQLETSYPGGLKAYVGNAKQLLADSKAGVNPLEGWTPSVPTGETLGYGRHSLHGTERLGSNWNSN